MLQKLTNITHTINTDPYYGERHNFGLTLTNLTDQQAVKFWEFIGELHIEQPEEDLSGWNRLQPIPQTDDDFDGTN